MLLTLKHKFLGVRWKAVSASDGSRPQGSNLYPALKLRLQREYASLTMLFFILSTDFIVFCKIEFQIELEVLYKASLALSIKS